MYKLLRGHILGSLPKMTDCSVMLLAAAAAAAKSLQSCPTLSDPIDVSPPGSPPWNSPGKNTGVGCHFLLQCRKVKNESEVTQSCLLVTPWTAAHQAPPSMGLSRQEYRSGVPLPSPDASCYPMQKIGTGRKELDTTERLI